MGFLLSAGAPVQRDQSPYRCQETHLQHEKKKMKISDFHCFSSYRLQGGASPLKMFKNRFNLDIEFQFINVLLLAWRSTRPQELIRSEFVIINENRWRGPNTEFRGTFDVFSEKLFCFRTVK